ncbi:unnamed protein product [Euphydryas editha]|uniref:Transposase n=1 Tax=Euphydryas editha TaxID=104508 RepID=A0AAU9V7R6_EUPED|nr:unnamed protein product [Euphydryas editha]
MTWRRASSPTPKKLKVSNSAIKVNASIFWNAKVVKYLEKQATITGLHYAEQIRKLRETFNENRRVKLRTELLFHQDNAPAHKVAIEKMAFKKRYLTYLNSHSMRQI